MIELGQTDSPQVWAVRVFPDLTQARSRHWDRGETILIGVCNGCWYR